MSAPARSADDGRWPSSSASPAIGTALPRVMISSRASTTGQAARMAVGWSRMPIETKKNVLNSSRSGTISPSTLAVRSESASASPATKAPSATLTPSASAANAVPIAMTATPMTNSSRERRPATTPSSRGRNARAGDDHERHEADGHGARPARGRGSTPPRGCRARRGRRPAPPSAGPARSTRRAPSARARWCAASPSPATLTRTTVDATATAPPMNSASSSSQPMSSPVAVPMAMVIATWTGVPARIAGADRAQLARG